MSAMKEYALGVCYAHPKEMYDLYDLLCGWEIAERAVEMEIVERFGGDTYPSKDMFEIMQGIADILENIPDEEALVMLKMVSLITDKPDLMEKELSFWRGRCAA